MVLRAARRPGAIALAALVAALAPAAAARADEPDAAQEADELFHEAGRAYDAGDYRLAHKLYSQVFERKKTHDVAAMLGQTEMKLGKPCEAAAHLAYAVETFPPSLVDERRALILRARAEAEKRIGSLRVDTVPPDASVQVDFEPVAAERLPGPFCVAAGDRVLFVGRDGFAVERRVVTVAPGEAAAIQVELRRLTKEAASPALPPLPPASSAQRVAPPLVSRPVDAGLPFAVAVLSAGVASLAAGAILLPLAKTRHDEANHLEARIEASGGRCTMPTDHGPDCVSLNELRRDEAGFLNAGVASLITGTVLATAAGGFLLFRPRTGAPGQRAPRVAALVGPRGAHVALTAEF